MRAFVLVLVAAGIGLLSQLSGLAYHPSPAYAQGALAIQEQFIDAFNRADAGAIESLLAPDFAVQNNANCTTPCDGRGELGVLLAIHLKVQVLSARESGDVVTGRIQGTSNLFDLVAPGVTRVFADTRLVVTNGKISLLDYQLDLSDAQSAELARQFRETRGQASGPLDVQNRFVDALNRGNLTALRSLTTAGFTITGNIGCASPCPGDAFLQLFVAIRLRLSVLSAEVAGSTVTSRVAAESTRFDQVAPGVNRVLADTKLTVSGGQASALDIELDLSDTLSAALAAELKESLPAAAAAAAAAAPAPERAQLAIPTTGDGGLLPGAEHRTALGLPIAVLALVLVTVAVAMRRRSV